MSPCSLKRLWSVWWQRRRGLGRGCWLLLGVLGASLPATGHAAGNQFPASAGALLQSACIDCHQGEDAEAGLDLETFMANAVADVGVAQDDTWTRIIDRVAAGEMPPADAEQPTLQERQLFVTRASDWLRDLQRSRDAAIGRVRGRRLNRQQVERSLHVLLGIDIPLADKLPDEGRPRGFTTVAERQAVSHHHLSRHLAVVDLALDEAFGRALGTVEPLSRELNAQGLVRKNPRRRCREPELREGEAVVWSCSMPYYGRLPATTAPADGWYAFRLKAHGIKLPESGGVWTAIHAGPCVSTAPLLEPVTCFEAGEQPRTIEFTTWLPKGHMLEIRPQDATIKRARFAGGQVGAGEGEPQDVPGVAINQLEMRQVYRFSVEELRQRLFGDLRYEKAKQTGLLKPVVTKPLVKIEGLLSAFACQAFRHPVPHEELIGYVELARDVHEQTRSFTEAVRAGYRAILCSPEFLYFREMPGQLDGYALATRLSYFVTGGPPDDDLLEAARSGRLDEAAEVRRQLQRLLEQGTPDQAGVPAAERQFVEDFAAEWLDLDQIDFTVPDRRMYWTFDPIVQMNMLAETHAFLAHLLHHDRPVTELIAADYTFGTSRLARFYGADDVQGEQLRQLVLPANTHRGGLLTQGAILKVTANGTTTSPVVRGAWVAERLLGIHIPPPPAGIPAIEPDIRGATTIREQLVKHRDDPACASCHRQMDPYGFALETFDPAGQWRTHYRSVGQKKNGTKLAIDSSGELPNGSVFASIDELKQELARDPQAIARGVAGNLLVWGTGAKLSIRDRQAVDKIVEAAGKKGYGFRAILEEVVVSPVFRSK